MPCIGWSEEDKKTKLHECYIGELIKKTAVFYLFMSEF